MVNARAHVFVSGHVQGVSYRYYTRRQANALGVTGWVRNLPDGRVEAVFEGSEKAVRHMVAWCYRGSPNAYIIEADVDYQPYTGEFNGFRLTYW
ncbi:MAG: acylphosphatase [Chloroflexota bacterium]|nr:acylphosphatase [Chloroflexota bacterium]